MTRSLLAAAAAVALLSPALAAQPTPLPASSITNYPTRGTGTVVLRAARVIDGTGAAPIANGEVVVTNDRIVAVRRQGGGDTPAGARVIDLGNATLLPGFIDSHVHIIGRTLNDPGSRDESTRDYPGFGAVLGAENARRTLMNGFTTIRVLGAPNFDDVALRSAIDQGYAIGPRIQAAGNSVGITGGHCDSNGYRPGLMESDYREGVADGLDQVRAAVRYQAKYGADAIKVCATGGVLSEGDAVGVPQYSQEELNALVAEARTLERPVAAHAHGAEGIKMATRAGVSSIEHGSFLDEEGARLMASRGTYLVPTLSAGETVVAAADRGVLTGLRAEKARQAGTAMRRAIRIAVAANVPIALGTDAGVGQHGANGHEFTLMTQWGGMSPMQAIVAGTRNAARLLGWEERLGTLASGKLADVVAVAGDPLQNVQTLETAIFVMKNGVVYKEPQRP
ncbi:MAG TPA: amidohydrolase family protein [Longimicrobium sp.]|nr:amidohydrolase family protein [Longimicrobium sp.]